MDCGYRLDFRVDENVIVEVKAAEKIMPIHKAQLLSYLKLSGCHPGLIITFNVPVLKEGIVRVAHRLPEPSPRTLRSPR